jgi:hypothetical protein
VLPAAGQASGTHTLRLDARFTYSHTTGRVEVATDKLSIGNRVVGHDMVACDEVTSSKFACGFTEFIGGHGTVQVHGFQGNPNPPVAMAIVGGTGSYVGAQGDNDHERRGYERRALHAELHAPERLSQRSWCRFNAPGYQKCCVPG